MDARFVVFGLVVNDSQYGASGVLGTGCIFSTGCVFVIGGCVLGIKLLI